MLFASNAWSLRWYLQGQLALLLVSFACAAWLLAEPPRSPARAILVCAGLLVANWPLAQTAAMVGLWAVNGFAP